MRYTDIGKDIKKLGFGLMRLPRKDEQFDLELLQKMVDIYLGKGFSYFDTAPVYGTTQSETIFGKLVAARYPREKFQIATKLPMWTLETPEEIPVKFENSLKALQVDYIDFYMLHGLSSVVSDRFPNSYLDKADRLGAWDFLKRMKAEGKAKHIGFSYHDSAEKLDEILSAHPESEFVQLQINYADWEDDVIQARRCYEVAQKHGVAVVVMEPCKGGTLVEMRADVADVFKTYDAKASLASWAIRYSASLDGIVTVLSGMSTMEQMLDNVGYMENFTPLTDEERNVIRTAKKKLEAVDTVGCTGCGYCLEGCPQQLRIPDLFRILNNQIIYGNKGDAYYRYKNLTSRTPKASDCIACGCCEGACPQHLPVISLLERTANTFEA